jgi:hypothetical protein
MRQRRLRPYENQLKAEKLRHGTPFIRETPHHLIASVIDDLYGDTTFLRFIEGTDRKCGLYTAYRTTLHQAPTH